MNEIKNHNYYLIIEHLIPTLMVSGIYLSLYSNIYILCLIIFFGWLIDLDHLYDYFLYLKITKNKTSFKYFLTGKYFNFNKKVYVILHSYELSLLFILISYISSREEIYFIFGSYFIHLIQDQVRNKPKKYGYFISYRFYNKFSLESFCK